jgi:hypothetical protein
LVSAHNFHEGEGSQNKIPQFFWTDSLFHDPVCNFPLELGMEKGLGS